MRELQPKLSQNYRSCSTVRVGTDVVSVVAAYSDLVCLCVVHCANKYYITMKKK